MRGFALVIGWWLLVAGPAVAQDFDSLWTSGTVLGRFTQASDLAMDPEGMLYVTDAASGQIIRLRPTGEVVGRLGSRGSGDGQFDAPAGLDPTNGLILLIADAGNGRIQRWSRDGRFLESLPVPSGDRNQRQTATTYLPRNAPVDTRADGRPVSVVSTPDDQIFVIEALSSTLLIWDRNRRLQQVVHDVQLVRPVALATDAHSVYVADAASGRIQVYDTFGTHVRAMGSVEGIRNLALSTGRLWAVMPDGLLGFESSGRLEERRRYAVEEEIVDAAVNADAVFVLTASALIRFEN